MVGPGSECTWDDEYLAKQSRKRAQRDGQGVVHESGYGVQERGSGCRGITVTHKRGFESWVVSSCVRSKDRRLGRS